MRLLWLPLILALSACTLPPMVQDEDQGAPVVTKPVTKKPSRSGTKQQADTSKAPVPNTPITKQMQQALPNGISIIDSKQVVQRAGYVDSKHLVLIWVNPDAGLDVFSAEDAQHHAYYKGKIDGAHAFELPDASRGPVNVVFNNRRNARFVVVMQP